MTQKALPDTISFSFLIPVYVYVFSIAFSLSMGSLLYTMLLGRFSPASLKIHPNPAVVVEYLESFAVNQIDHSMILKTWPSCSINIIPGINNSRTLLSMILTEQELDMRGFLLAPGAPFTHIVDLRVGYRYVITPIVLYL